MLYNPSRTEMLDFFPDNPDSILDVGCSTGSFGRTLRDRFPDTYRVGVDPNPEALQAASREYSDVVLGNFPDVVPDLPAGTPRYDAIAFHDVLEHMANPEEALVAARALVSEKGVVVASIPNVRHLSVIGPLVAKGEFRYRDSGILDRTHLRFFTGSSIRRLFDDCGWQIVRMQGINRGLRVGDAGRRAWMDAASRLTGGRTDSFFFVQYAVVARSRT